MGQMHHLPPLSLAQTRCWGQLSGGRRPWFPTDPSTKPGVSCFPGRELSRASLKRSINQTLFFVCTLCSPHQKLEPRLSPSLPPDGFPCPSFPHRYAVSASLVPADPPSRSRQLDKTQVRQPCRSAGRIPAMLGDEHLPFHLWSGAGGSGLFPLFPMLGCAVLETHLNSISVQIWFR